MAKHNDTGAWGEQIACERLVAEGYAIMERNWRMGHLEVDIIAMKDDSIVFAEVKTRTDVADDPLSAVDMRKVRHLAAAADAYLKAFDLHHVPRFDIFGIAGTPEDFRVEHLPDAFFPPLKTY